MSNIKLTIEKSTLEKNLEKIEAPLLLVENCTKTAIHNLNDSFNAFWSLPDDQIEEILNYFGPLKVQEVFGAHFEHAVGFNKLLDSRGVGGNWTRAITVKPREITMDENGVMSLVPLPVEETPIEDPPSIPTDEIP